MVTAIRHWLARKLLGNTFEAAQYSTRRSLLWSTYQSARFDVTKAARTELAKKARYYERNSWLANKLADIFETGTVGNGLVIQPTTPDEEWNAKAAEWWLNWTRFPDLTSLQSFPTLQTLMARSWFIDGEVFILKTIGESGRPRVQLVEGHCVQTPPGEESNPRWIDGIYVDPNGRPAAYSIAQETKAGTYTFLDPIPADRVRHLFEPNRPGQYRGVTFLAPVLNALHDLDDLWKLEMQVAKMAGTLGIVQTNGSGTFDPMAFRRQQVTGSNISAGGTAVSETTQELVEDATGATAVALRAGEDLKQFVASRPTEQQRAHWALVSKSICIGVGIPYVMVDPDSMQGTVYRGSLDLAASFFAQRSAVIADTCRDIYGWVMSIARNSPELRPAPARYWSCNVYPPRAVNVDVGYTMNASLASLAAGTDTFDTLLSPRGTDWRSILRQKAEQARYIRDLAAEFEIDPSEISNVPLAQPQRTPQPAQEIATP